MSTATDGGYQRRLVSVGEDEVVVTVLVVDGHDKSIRGWKSRDQGSHGVRQGSHCIAGVQVDDQLSGSGLLTVVCEESDFDFHYHLPISAILLIALSRLGELRLATESDRGSSAPSVTNIGVDRKVHIHRNLMSPLTERG